MYKHKHMDMHMCREGDGVPDGEMEAVHVVEPLRDEARDRQQVAERRLRQHGHPPLEATVWLREAHLGWGLGWE